MASISSLGVGSGLDLSSILDSLTAAQKATLTPISNQQSSFTAKLSAYGTLKSALSEINNNLQRVRELTVQATTGTNSQSDLDSIQDEIKSRLDEIDRVSGQTQFNGVNVLAKDGSMKIQVGANDGQTLSLIHI